MSGVTSATAFASSFTPKSTEKRCFPHTMQWIGLSGVERMVHTWSHQLCQYRTSDSKSIGAYASFTVSGGIMRSVSTQHPRKDRGRDREAFRRWLRLAVVACGFPL
eukprot:3870227-Rhodomonas_salina.1